MQGEKPFRLLNVPQTFQVPHTPGQDIFSPEILNLSAATLLPVLLETNLKKMGEMAILEFPTSQSQRDHDSTYMWYLAKVRETESER